MSESWVWDTSPHCIRPAEFCTLDAVRPVSPEDSWTLEPGCLPSLCPGFSLLATRWVPRRGQESSDEHQAGKHLRTAQMQTHGLQTPHRRDEPLEDLRSTWYFGGQGSDLWCVSRGAHFWPSQSAGSLLAQAVARGTPAPALALCVVRCGGELGPSVTACVG